MRHMWGYTSISINLTMCAIWAMNYRLNVAFLFSQEHVLVYHTVTGNINSLAYIVLLQTTDSVAPLFWVSKEEELGLVAE